MVIDPRFDGRIREGAALLPTIHPGDSHAATLVETAAGDLLCAWFNGPGEGEPETRIVLSRLPAGSDTWTEPVRVTSGSETVGFVEGRRGCLDCWSRKLEPAG